MFDSGHYTWWPKASVHAIRAAHHWLDEYAAEHGPYDAVCCFSQGCSLVASYLLYHARETPTAPLPFRAAIFICGGLPLPVLEDLVPPGARALSPRAHAVNDETVRLLKARAGALTDLAAHPERIRRGRGLWDDTAGLLHDPLVMPPPDDVFGMDFTAMPPDLRIRIPTVHVYGAKDPRWPASVQLAHFCEDRRMYDHWGGHDIPRSTAVSDRMAELVRQLEREVAR